MTRQTPINTIEPLATAMQRVSSVWSRGAPRGSAMTSVDAAAFATVSHFLATLAAGTADALGGDHITRMAWDSDDARSATRPLPGALWASVLLRPEANNIVPTRQVFIRLTPEGVLEAGLMVVVDETGLDVQDLQHEIRAVSPPVFRQVAKARKGKAIPGGWSLEWCLPMLSAAPDGSSVNDWLSAVGKFKRSDLRTISLARDVDLDAGDITQLREVTQHLMTQLARLLPPGAVMAKEAGTPVAQTQDTPEQPQTDETTQTTQPKQASGVEALIAAAVAGTAPAEDPVAEEDTAPALQDAPSADPAPVPAAGLVACLRALAATPQDTACAEQLCAALARETATADAPDVTPRADAASATGGVTVHFDLPTPEDQPAARASLHLSPSRGEVTLTVSYALQYHLSKFGGRASVVAMNTTRQKIRARMLPLTALGFELGRDSAQTGEDDTRTWHEMILTARCTRTLDDLDDAPDLLRQAAGMVSVFRDIGATRTV